MNEQEIQQEIDRASRLTEELKNRELIALVSRVYDVCMGIGVDPVQALKDFADTIERTGKK